LSRLDRVNDPVFLLSSPSKTLCCILCS